MVLLTITSSISEALQKAQGLEKFQQLKSGVNKETNPLDEPKIGNPISHGQIIDLWKILRDGGHADYTLERLLQGSRVYVPPPPPKPEPSDEYKELMARLRRQEEQRAYERMTNPLPPTETFSHRFPNAKGMAQAFAEANRPTRDEDIGDDDVTFNDVNRQLMVIFNILLSILGVAGTLWTLARWWSTPARLFLAMGGGVLVGIAEVVLYSGYMWHLGDAKKKEKKFNEVKQVVQTWTVGTDDGDGLWKNEPVTIREKSSIEDTNLRRRNIEKAAT